jgi:hypothetical protein
VRNQTTPLTKKVKITMKVIVVALLISSFLSLKTEAAPELLDSVSVIVDQGVVLESQITELIAVVKRNSSYRKTDHR